MMYRFFIFVFTATFLLSTKLYAGGAGVFPITIDANGDLVGLIGQETRHPYKKPHISYQALSDFGGAREKDNAGKEEPEYKAAYREFKEETGYTSFPHICELTIKNALSVYAPTGYRMYILYLDQQNWVDAQTVQNNVDAAWNQGFPHVEKTQIMQVKIKDLLQAVKNPIPTMHGGSKAKLPAYPAQLYNLFRELLQNPETQNILATLEQAYQPLPPQGRQDLIMTYSLTAQKQNDLFNKVVKGNIPGVKGPDPYHVTLGWVKNVHPEHYAGLQTRFKNIVDNAVAKMTFTANSVKKYLKGARTPTSSPLVLTPTKAEKANFKAINRALHQELNNFNAQNATMYTFLPDVHPATYMPHITLINTPSIKKLGINRDQIIQAITPQIKGKGFEFLQPVPISPIAKPAPVVLSVLPDQRVLSSSLNPQFDLDEKTALPKGWKLVDSSQNRGINKPVTLKKKALGVEVLGDNYTFYTDMPSLNNYDQTTFLFSVELRGTKPGTYIQYWDGVKSVSSALYNGNKKGDWETLRVEFTVDAKKARFHRLYAAILGTTKGTDNPSVDIRGIKLEPKPL